MSGAGRASAPVDDIVPWLIPALPQIWATGTPSQHNCTTGSVEAAIRLMLSRVVVGHNRLQLVFPEAGLRSVLGVPRDDSVWPANAPDPDEEFTLTVPFTAARRGRQIKLVLPNAGSRTSVDRSLVTAIARAWDWSGRLLSGEVATMAGICAAEGFTDAYVSRLLPLAFLSPNIVEQILTGQQPAGLTANRLIWGDRLPTRWSEQMATRPKG